MIKLNKQCNQVFCYKKNKRIIPTLLPIPPAPHQVVIKIIKRSKKKKEKIK